MYLGAGDLVHSYQSNKESLSGGSSSEEEKKKMRTASQDNRFFLGSVRSENNSPGRQARKAFSTCKVERNLLIKMFWKREERMSSEWT